MSTPGKNQNFGCREKYSSTSPKSQQSGHLNRPLFRQSALSPVCCIVCRLFWPIAHFRQVNSLTSFGQFGTLMFRIFDQTPTFGQTPNFGQLVSGIFGQTPTFGQLYVVFSAKRPLSANWLCGIFGQTLTFGQLVMWYFRPNTQFSLVITDDFGSLVEIGQIKHSSCLSCCNTNLVLQYSCCNLERELSTSILCPFVSCVSSTLSWKKQKTSYPRLSQNNTIPLWAPKCALNLKKLLKTN